MIGHNGNETKNSALSDSALAGGLSGALTRLLLQPLDVIKTRFQLQVEPISRKHETSKYRSMSQAVKVICQEETVFALWKGHVSAQILSVMFGVAQFTVYEELTKVTTHLNTDSFHGTALNFCSGGIASGFATIISFPFDLVRTRFIAQGQTKAYTSVYDAVAKIIRVEGFKGLYKGLTPTLIQSAPYGACQFGYFTIFSKIDANFHVFSQTSDGSKSTSSSLTAGFLAGMCAKATTYPLDLSRKRLQIQGFHEARKGFGKAFICNGFIDCLVKIYAEESFKGFFKGLQPSLLKSAVTTSLYFAFYEQILEFLRMNSQSH
ncbi:mitochondrial thiamine pyrophosphate carrier-like isoform X2 [Planococcus citri]